MNHVGSNIQNHKTKEKAPCQGKVPSKEPVFQKAPGNPVPPAQNQISTMLQMISSLFKYHGGVGAVCCVLTP